MKSRDEIITSMCYTYRHDYGLTRSDDEPVWASGMTQRDREALWKTMAQIFDNAIAPYMEIKTNDINC